MLKVENLIVETPLSKEISHSFEITLTNEGDSNIVVTDIKPSCSCSTTTINNLLIKPGETTQVPFAVSLINVMGDIFKSADIYYNYKNQNHAINWSVKFTQI